MDTTQSKPRSISIPGQRRRNLAAKLLALHPLHTPSATPLLSRASQVSDPPIRVVCISDTHNRQPELPPGDILIHAGDLTENGSFDEVQTQLTWLSSQPHQYKVVVAGNHDVLLDEEFLDKYPERRYGQQKTMHDLNWGCVKYLQNSSITLDFDHTGGDRNREDGPATPREHVRTTGRKVTIYGSPLTPQYGNSAFQYPRDQDVWCGKVPDDTDIVISHGPPRFHLDTRDFHRAGCQYLGHEIARVRPRLVVFGHIHTSYGREDLVLNAVRQKYDDIMGNWEGWTGLLSMAIGVLWAKLCAVFMTRDTMIRRDRVTTFVNASVVGGSSNELRNQPVVIEL